MLYLLTITTTTKIIRISHHNYVITCCTSIGNVSHTTLHFPYTWWKNECMRLACLILVDISTLGYWHYSFVFWVLFECKYSPNRHEIIFCIWMFICMPDLWKKSLIEISIIMKQSVHSVTPKPDRGIFVNNEKINKKIPISDG